MTEIHDGEATSTVHVNGADLTIATYRGLRVLTSERLAKVFDATEKMISNNFDRNLDRFQDGRHFFRIDGEALRELKHEPSFGGLVGRNAKQVILWTERGVARHAKILDTDRAWDIFTELEDGYFTVRDAPQAVQPKTYAEMLLESSKILVEQERKLAEIDARQDAHDAQLARIGEKVALIERSATVLPSPPAGAESISAIRSRIGREFGLPASTIDDVVLHSPLALKPAGLVENPHDDAPPYQVFWRRQVTDLFQRFTSECELSGKRWRHAFIPRKFKMNRQPTDSNAAQKMRAEVVYLSG